MSEEKTLRIGVIGAGRNTLDRHIPHLQALEGVEVVGVCNRSAESSRRAADAAGVAETYPRWEDVIADDRLDAVVIGTWPNMHAPATLAALAAGKHVLVEARMAMNASEARRMRDAAAQRPQLIAQVVPSPMTLAFDAEIRRRIDAGELGRILAVEVRDRQGWFDPDAPLTWRQDERLSGLNTLTLGIWYEAVLRWLGPAESVRADGRVFAETRRDGSGEAHEVVLPEHLDVIARLACGAQMHMGLSSVCGAAGASQVWIFGSEATLSLRGGELLEARRGETELSPQEVPEQRRGRWRVEEEFVNAIRGREEVTLTDFDTGVAYMEFTEAVAQSLRAGREIGIPAPATP